ncbi:nitroreductase family deazaflavin-dependent oxidoreductase [Millisia brevis]|uniref:nitroreductase family deazaflavin-dependent oxidoreductase n=1 Tax=Millisia brevis TaxID=264148 RepID=UPI00248053D1|nr:nitroreductase family deazaflavin-dependent oxidoreductase [Millisia brevis]
MPPLGRCGGLSPVGPTRVLTVPGRRTGEPRSTPVTPITVDGARYVIAALPNADWARNIRAAGHGELAQGRRRVAYTIREVADLDVCRSVLRAFPVQARGGVPFYVRLGLVDGPDPDQFAAVADKVAVFELIDPRRPA